MQVSQTKVMAGPGNLVRYLGLESDESWRRTLTVPLLKKHNSYLHS